MASSTAGPDRGFEAVTRTVKRLMQGNWFGNRTLFFGFTDTTWGIHPGLTLHVGDDAYDLDDAHTGSTTGTDDRPEVIVAFNQSVAAIAADTPSVTVAGGTLDAVRRHTEVGSANLWAFAIDPDGDGDGDAGGAGPCHHPRTAAGPVARQRGAGTNSPSP